VASSSLIRWGVVATTVGGALFSIVDPAVVGPFAGQQTLRALGTIALSGGLIAFLSGFVGTGSLVGLNHERKAAALASFALGGYCLLALPIYYLIFTDTIRVYGGESPMCLLLSLVLVPLLVRKGSSGELLAATLISAFAALVQVLAAFLALEVPGVGLTTVFSEAGRSVPLFQRVEGCTLVMCGLDHVLFHFSQIPFLAVIGIFGYRAYRSIPR
jgi:hypothetical protein